MSDNSEKTFSFEDVVESLGEGVIVVDPGRRVRVFNQAAEKITEVSRSAVLGRPVSDVFGGGEALVGMLTKTLTEGRLFAEYEESLTRRFSGPLPVGITTSQVFGPAGELTGVAALVKDLSGIKSLEKGSLRKERLAYIGAFAANLAHEIKNPLSGIRGVAQLLARRAKDEKTGEFAGVIIREADRLGGILNGMLDFARPARLDVKPFNIHRVLDSVILLIEQGEEGGGGEGAAGRPPEIRKEYDPSIPEVLGDESRLTQVFLNLVKNAREAVSTDGSIRVVTRVATDFHLAAAAGGGGGGGEIKAGRQRRRLMASVEIRDNGCGIRAENMEKIFTPFFTTKQGGSGLGMAITLKIVKEHGGLLQIDSAPGRGTSVVVYLPLAEG
ncbi:MAG: nitrogen regulation protein NR(II) [Thermodesulfobacteriota bacterium]